MEVKMKKEMNENRNTFAVLELEMCTDVGVPKEKERKASAIQ